MASIAAYRRRVTELVGVVWLAVQIARLVRSRGMTPGRDRGVTRMKEGIGWQQ
jgi:hypothetical protein